jgi:hypothetical protein
MNIDNIKSIITNYDGLSAPMSYVDLKAALHLKGSHAVVSSLVRLGVISADRPAKNPGQNLSLWDDAAVMTLGPLRGFQDLLVSEVEKLEAKAAKSLAAETARAAKIAAKAPKGKGKTAGKPAAKAKTGK